eukprot:4321511-Amphidinium_carterae.1
MSVATGWLTMEVYHKRTRGWKICCKSLWLTIGSPSNARLAEPHPDRPVRQVGVGIRLISRCQTLFNTQGRTCTLDSMSGCSINMRSASCCCWVMCEKWLSACSDARRAKAH